MKGITTAFSLLSCFTAVSLAAPTATSSDPRTAVLSFRPAWGKADQLAAYLEKGQAYIRQNVPSCLDIWYFREAGSDRLVVGERYTNESALWDWARSDEHTAIAKDLPGLIDIFSATIQSDITFGDQNNLRVAYGLSTSA